MEVMLRRWSFGSVLLLIAIFISLLPAVSHAAMFLNSAESQCDGSDPTIMMCDDYEDGSWFVTNADSGGRNDPQNDGWAGTIYFVDPLGLNFARCGAKGAAGTNCTSTTGYRNTKPALGSGQGHHMLGPTTPTYPNEIYHREYIKFSPGYVFGHEKVTFYERSNSSVQHGLTQTPFGSSEIDFATQSGSGCPGGRCKQNQGVNISFIPGNWYYMETHLVLGNGSNGRVEIWIDDCGTNGLGCTGPGTLRLSHSNLSFTKWSQGCCDVHQENWCPSDATPPNAGSCAGEVHRDQTVFATRRIGPIAAGAPAGPAQGGATRAHRAAPCCPRRAARATRPAAAGPAPSRP